MENSYTYTYLEYLSDIDEIVVRLENIDNLHLVGIYRGGLPMTIHLSNLLKCSMSIVRLQTDDDRAVFICNDIKSDNNVIVLDDIYDSGKTIRLVQELLSSYKSVKYLCLYGRSNDDGVEYLRESHKRWIIFPHEISLKDLIDNNKNIPDYWKPENN